MQQIHSILTDVFGADVKVLLFGSRTDDNQKGGDIDLLVEADYSDDELYMKKLKALGLLKKKLGDRKIDLVVHSELSKDFSLIVKEAHRTGIRI